MPTVTVHVAQEAYPGLVFPGCPFLPAGVPVEVTVEQVAVIKQSFQGFQPSVKSRVQLSFSGLDASPTPAHLEGAIATPPPPPPAPSSEDLTPPTEEVLEEVEDIVELSDEDLDLVNIEVSKLLNKTIAQAEPALIATAGAPELPRTLRKAYLEAVIAHDDIQKGLKDTAEKLLEQI